MSRPQRVNFDEEMDWLSAVSAWLQRKYPGDYGQRKRVAKWKQIDQDNNERQGIMTSNTSKTQAERLTAEPSARQLAINEILTITNNADASGKALTEEELARGGVLLATIRTEYAKEQKAAGQRESIAGGGDAGGDGQSAKPSTTSGKQGDDLRRRGY